MPLFRCEKCGVIENTALSLCSWTSKVKLCSQCCPEQKKWHGRFKRTKKVSKDEVLKWEK
jgi:hypothetical protein